MVGSSSTAGREQHCLRQKSWVASCATGKLLQSDVPEWRFFWIYEDQVGSFSTSFGWEKNLGSITCLFHIWTFQLDPKIPIGGGVSLGWFLLLPLPKSQSKKKLFGDLFQRRPYKSPPLVASGCKDIA